MTGAGPSTQPALLPARTACLGGPSLASHTSASSWAPPQKYPSAQAGHLLKMRNKDVPKEADIWSQRPSADLGSSRQSCQEQEDLDCKQAATGTEPPPCRKDLRQAHQEHGQGRDWQPGLGGKGGHGQAGRGWGAKQNLLVPSGPGTHRYQAGHDGPHKGREEEGTTPTASYFICVLLSDLWGNARFQICTRRCWSY